MDEQESDIDGFAGRFTQTAILASIVQAAANDEDAASYRESVTNAMKIVAGGLYRQADLSPQQLEILEFVERVIDGLENWEDPDEDRDDWDGGDGDFDPFGSPELALAV